MKLRKFLDQENLTLEAFAERIDRSVATVSRLARGLNQPDWATMEAIFEATGGKVRPNDFAKPKATARRVA